MISYIKFTKLILIAGTKTFGRWKYSINRVNAIFKVDQISLRIPTCDLRNVD